MMKHKVLPFVAGALTMALVSSISVGAFAAVGQLTITVNPVSIQVNGQTFQPKDAQGRDVPVFAYNGTTYAPLRALAEAYGLEVGYDAASNIATVKDPGTTTPAEIAPDTTTSGDYSNWSAEMDAGYQEFKQMWEITPRDSGTGQFGKEYEAFNLSLITPKPEGELEQLREILETYSTNGFMQRLSDEVKTKDVRIALWFYVEPDYRIFFYETEMP